MRTKQKKSTIVSTAKRVKIPEKEMLKQIRARAIKKAVVELHAYGMDELEDKLKIKPTIH